MQKIEKALEGSLRNPDLLDVDRALLQEGLDKANNNEEYWISQNNSKRYLTRVRGNENYLNYLEDLSAEEILNDFNREFQSWRG